MSDSSKEEVESGSATFAGRCTLAAVTGLIAGAFIGSVLSWIFAALKYGSLGHGGTSTDWRHVFNVALGFGALGGAACGAIFAVMIFLVRNDNAQRAAGESLRE